jgi:hypothetical protein
MRHIDHHLLRGLEGLVLRVPHQRVREQQEAARHLPFIPLGQIFTPVAHRSTVTGLIAMPIPVLWNVGT